MPQGGAPFPGMPAYPQGYGGMPIQAPSGGTAITAGVLGILGAVWAIIAALVNIGALSAVTGSPLAWVVDMQVVAFVIELLTLGPGSIMLLMRRMAGRWLVAFGAAIHIVQGIVAIIAFLSVSTAVATASGASKGEIVGGGVGGLLIVLAPAIATLILALLPLTGRWCEWRTQRVAGAY